MEIEMNNAYKTYLDKGYYVLKSYDQQTNRYIDVKKELRPDIIFYTSPYYGLIDKRYYISNYRDILSIYVPYSFNNSCAFDQNYNLLLYNLLWRHYLPTKRHLEYSKQYARNKGINSFVTGYPGIETLIDNHKPSNNDWKIKSDKKKKKIIWAPHHTIEPVGVVFFSCFLRYCDFMLNMAKNYQNEIQIVFKPHPILKSKLYKRWGKEKTDDYYSEWETMPNTSINEGGYEDLFLTSDAMIHDSGSFVAEYLYVNRTVMRTLNEVDEAEKMNDLAMECISNHYLARNEQDIEQFIQNVINDVDPMREQRTKFINDVLMPKGSPSQNIIDDILDSIDNQILYRN
ncbi:MAG: CDP-glycerol glycerophosphotransferase family protein [Clostridia bacterium]|nr:CDP-glycerol glycerophosphotransferase family protein [Clostridia bacterium]